LRPVVRRVGNFLGPATAHHSNGGLLRQSNRRARDGVFKVSRRRSSPASSDLCRSSSAAAELDRQRSSSAKPASAREPPCPDADFFRTARRPTRRSGDSKRAPLLPLRCPISRPLFEGDREPMQRWIMPLLVGIATLAIPAAKLAAKDATFHTKLFGVTPNVP